MNVHALAEALAVRYNGQPYVTVADGWRAHVVMRRGAVSDYYADNTGGHVWNAFAVHAAEDGHVLTVCTLDGMWALRLPEAVAAAGAEAAAGWLWDLCGEDREFQLATATGANAEDVGDAEWAAVLAALWAIQPEGPSVDDYGMRTADGASLLAWVNDLEARVGLDVDSLRYAMFAYLDAIGFTPEGGE